MKRENNSSELLKALERRDNLMFKYSNDFIEEIAFNKENNCYHNAKNGFFTYELNFLFNVASGINKDFELLLKK